MTGLLQMSKEVGRYLKKKKRVGHLAEAQKNIQRICEAVGAERISAVRPEQVKQFMELFRMIRDNGLSVDEVIKVEVPAKETIKLFIEKVKSAYIETEIGSEDAAYVLFFLSTALCIDHFGMTVEEIRERTSEYLDELESEL